MVYEISIRQDLAALEQHLTRIEREQLPFAAAKALTSVAWSAAKHLKLNLPKWIDRPTPFTLRAFRVRRATKRRQVSSVYIAEIQDDYLRWQIEGGTRTPKGAAIPVPGRALKRNKYGNMPRRGGSRALSAASRKNTFVGVAGRSQTAGIWQRTGGKRNPGLRLLVAFRPTASYRAGRIPYRRAVLATVDRLIGPALDDALRQAVETARTNA